MYDRYLGKYLYIGCVRINPISFDSFFKTLFHKNSNFRTIRLKVSTFVANGLSFQLSKSDLTHRPSFSTFITRSKKSGSIC